jgi:hypothetical protein
MRRRNWVVGLVLLGAAGWYLFRPELLIVNKRVNEPPPAGMMQASEAAPPAASAGSARASAAEPAPLLAGSFHGVAHDTKGRATVHRLPDGSRVLRLTQFETSNGPDVRVYLVAAPDAADDEAVTRAGFVELGKLKGNQGDQNYAFPGNIDLGRYRAATIWCKRFGVNFGTAPLTPRPTTVSTHFHGAAVEGATSAM